MPLQPIKCFFNQLICLSFQRYNFSVNIPLKSQHFLMIIDSHQSEKRLFAYSKENLWSELAWEFKNYQQNIHKIITSSGLNPKQSFPASQDCVDMNVKIRDLSVRLQRQIKKKMADFLFHISVNDSEINKIKNQLKDLQDDRNSLMLQKEEEIKKMSEKQTELQTLVKLYEKALINSKKQIMNVEINHQIFQNQQKDEPFKDKQRLAFFKLYNIKLQSRLQDCNNSSCSQLSYSRLTSSRMSRSGVNAGGLRQMEKAWNKSVNLSSKSIKSGYQKAAEEKTFIKTHMRHNSFNKQPINERTPCSQLRSVNTNKQNALVESSVSEFNILKN